MDGQEHVLLVHSSGPTKRKLSLMEATLPIIAMVYAFSTIFLVILESFCRAKYDV